MTERYESPALDALRASARDARQTADWLQSLAADAQRRAQRAQRDVEREKMRVRETTTTTTQQDLRRSDRLADRDENVQSTKIV